MKQNTKSMITQVAVETAKTKASDAVETAKDVATNTVNTAKEKIGGLRK